MKLTDIFRRLFNDGNKLNRLNNLHIYDDNNEEKRTITINSDILKADIVGSFSAATLHESFLKIANNHLPSFDIKYDKRKRTTTTSIE